MQAVRYCSPVKIAILIDGFGVGGTELNATRTLEAFARRGLIVDVLHFHADGALRGRIAAAGHRLTHVPIVPLWSPRIALRTAALASAIRQTGATVVHAQDVYSNILGVAATRLLVRPAMLTSRRWKDDVPRKVLTPLNAWAHRRSTLVLPNSPALVSTLEEEGVRADHISVHENFVDDQALTMLSAAERGDWRRALGIRENALVVGCVARLGRVKRHDVLLDAFALTLAQCPGAQLVLIGDGAEREALEQRARALDISADVIFTGTLPNYPLAQQLFDVAVLTSENEGFPNSLVEASACGVPLVATMVGGVPEVLREGVTGSGVAVGDVTATANALAALLSDRAQRERFGRAARAEVLARFSEAAAIDRLLAIYARVSA